MKNRRNLPTGALTVCALTFAGFILTGCVQSPPPFDPKLYTEPQRRISHDNVTLEPLPLPTTHQSEYVDEPNGKTPATRTAYPARPPVPHLAMTLREVLQLAAVNNSEVLSAGYQTAQDAARIVEALAKFDPSFFVNVQYQHQEASPFYGTNPLNPLKSLQWQNDAGFKMTLPNGAQVELHMLTVDNSIEQGNNFALTQRHYWTQALQLQITQPLLQNFGTEVNLARVSIARNDQRISLLDWRDKLEDTLAKTEQAYWQLYLTDKEVEIQERLLRATVDTADFLRKRKGQDVAKLQLGQAESAIRDRERDLVQTRGRVRDLSDQLKAFMYSPDLLIAGPIVIDPSDDPVTLPITFNMSEQIDTALDNRLELQQQMLRINSADVVVKAAKNNLLPQLNVVGQIDFEGIGDNFHDTVKSQSRGDFFDYQIGLQFEVPLGNRAARAIWQRTLLQRQQAIEAYRGLVQKVVFDVRQAQNAVEVAWERIRASRRARLAQQATYGYYEELQRGGEVPTPNFVQLKLDAAAKVADDERQEYEAIADYNIALSALERAKGTLLRYNDIGLAEAPNALKY